MTHRFSSFLPPHLLRFLFGRPFPFPIPAPPLCATAIPVVEDAAAAAVWPGTSRISRPPPVYPSPDFYGMIPGILFAVARSGSQAPYRTYACAGCLLCRG
jgi:hypothetical protein